MRKTSLSFLFFVFFLQNAHMQMKSSEIRTDQIKSSEIKLTTSKIRPGRTYSGRPAAVPRTSVGVGDPSSRGR
jgi:hypothetical protein